MDRRFGGVLLLLVAVVLVVVVPQALDPGYPGIAARAPLPLPPSVGSCLTEPDNVTVPCDEPHDKEVTAAWVATDPARPRRNDLTPCWAAAQAYVRESAAADSAEPVGVRGWQRYGVVFDAQLVRAPQEERAGRLGWKVCVVLPVQGGNYRGSALGVGRLGARPGAFGACSKGLPAVVTSAFPDVNCGQPHAGEFLGWTSGFKPDLQLPEAAASFRTVPGPDELRKQCAALAVELLEVEDPTYGGALVVDTLIEATSGTGSTAGANEVGGEIISQQTYSGIQTNALCMVRPAGDQMLVNSVIGWGAEKLPLQ